MRALRRTAVRETPFSPTSARLLSRLEGRVVHVTKELRQVSIIAPTAGDSFPENDEYLFIPVKWRLHPDGAGHKANKTEGFALTEPIA